MLHSLKLLKESYENNQKIIEKINNLIGPGLYTFELLEKENRMYDGFLHIGREKLKLELKQRQDDTFLKSIADENPIFAPLYIIQTHYQKENPKELICYIIFDKSFKYAILCDSGNFERKTVTENDITKYICRGNGLFFDFIKNEINFINLKSLKILK